MKLLQKIFNPSDYEKDLEKTNKELKKNESDLLDEIADLEFKLHERTDRLIELLEEKGIGFDKYLQYHDDLVEAKSQIKEHKKTISDLRTLHDNFYIELSEYLNKINLNKLIKKVPKCEDDDSLMLTLQAYIYTNEELPMRNIIAACNRFNLTKSVIKEFYPIIYKGLKVEDWEIYE